MKIIEKSLVLPKDKYFQKHLSIINPLLPIQLTYKEIEVISIFLSVESEIGSDNIFTSLGKKKVREKLNISHAGLSNYIKILKDKHIFIEDVNTKELKIIDIIKPNEPMQGYKIKLILE